MAESITASEIYLKDLFSEKYLFEIPYFQRQFAWNEENFEQLVDDIKDGLKAFGESEPYFLGSIILWAKEQNEDGSGLYAVIDGQQRLTCLTILMACLRDLADKDKATKTLQSRIYQEEDEYAGAKESVRVKVREQEFEFFKKFILTQGGTHLVRDLNVDDLSEPKRHIVQAIRLFSAAFQSDTGFINHALVDDFIKYLLQRVVLVAVRTTSLVSAFRLFNIINARGLPLSNADLLKSENLQVVPEYERPKYTRIWEDIEEDIGVDNLEMLMSFMRTILLREKARRAIFDEFDQKVFKEMQQFKGKPFIDYLERVSSIYRNKISEPSVKLEDTHKEIYYHNLVSIMRDFLPFNDWMTAVIRFTDRFQDDKCLYNFVKKLEKKIVIEWFRGLSFTERLTQIFNVIKKIDSSEEPSEVIKDPLFDLTPYTNDFLATLNGKDFYSRGKARIPKYALLRIDMEEQDNLHKEISFKGDITVEHILPQTPTHDYWFTRFDERVRRDMTNILGNLVLLNGKKNSKASNKPFDEKVKEYFAKRSDFWITNEIDANNDWNPEALNKRHLNLIERATKTWLS
jgi:hypothetical protein